MKINEIMAIQLITITPNDSVARVIDLMEKFKISGLPVLDNEQLVGIIASRDVRNSHPNRLTADAMSRNVITVDPECSIWEARDIIEQYNIGRLLVVENSKLVGILTKSRLYAELGKYSDFLTGLQRAPFLYYKAEKLLDKGNEITIIFFDLNNFGKIDKEWGHATGDEILQEVANILTRIIKPEIDYLCRYGGDEFAIVSKRNLENAKKLAFQIVEILGKNIWLHQVKITGTIGVAGSQNIYNQSEIPKKQIIKTLVNMASLASTRAKKEGKTVVLAGALELEKAKCFLY